MKSKKKVGESKAGERIANEKKREEKRYIFLLFSIVETIDAIAQRVEKVSHER